MLVLAHRGYHAGLPENTLAAFDAALQLGADGVETDVQATRDGKVILFHDRVLQGQEISALTHAELISLAGYEVPTLIDALDAFAGIFWNLEIKTPTDFAPIFAVLRGYRTHRRMLVSSFSHPLAMRVRKELRIDCGLLVAHQPLALDGLLMGADTERLALVWNYESVNAGLVDEARSRGVVSYVYGVQTVADHEHVASWKVAGIITDHPALMKRIKVS